MPSAPSVTRANAMWTRAAIHGDAGPPVVALADLARRPDPAGVRDVPDAARATLAGDVHVAAAVGRHVVAGDGRAR